MVGAGAGGLAQVAVYPLEVIQTRLAATHGVYAGILDATAKIWRTEGASAFMRCAAAGGLLVWVPDGLNLHMTAEMHQLLLLAYRAPSRACVLLLTHGLWCLYYFLYSSVLRTLS